MSRRITFLITDLDRGGSPLLLADLAPGLLDAGFDVEVVSIAPEGEIARLLRHRGVPVFSLNADGRGDFSILPRFVNYLRRSRPHLVASILIHANLLAALSRPFITHPTTWVHSIHTLQERPRWHWYLQGLLNTWADSFVAPSRAVVHRLERFGPVPRPEVIANGIDLERFRHSLPIPASQRPWPEGTRVVGYIGRFDPVKRLPLLLRAMPLLVPAFPNCHLALIGYGPQEAHLRALAKELHLEDFVHFLPATAEPERWYKTFDVFCSPSAAEGFGLTLAEAAAAGVPVVACRTAAVRETVQKAAWIPEDAVPQDVAVAIGSIFKESGSLVAHSRAQSVTSVKMMTAAYAGYFQRLLLPADV